MLREIQERPLKIATIGFTKKSAEQFFCLLRQANIATLVDIRLKNSSQLAGFAQGRDLPFFLQELVGAEYLHLPQLAPTPELLARYREDEDWAAYEIEFARLLEQTERREALASLNGLNQPVCLLCSEDTPERCHRRLVAERLRLDVPGLEIVHLV